ncbi:response regulator transcription factor [Cohnella zeiphila]|uniref:Response regulator n=1 Tax=Cohnella zeiphila TaxID=2761120 RepID=A0A7X0VY86_9BACL|nr:response regulator [Cohnella zeiphila]MBB6734227.1 response regulator [Cohnella zeiphila]
MDQAFKLLLVDDEPLALRRLRSFSLASRGFVVVGEAENGLQALEAIDRLRPDIVVTDIGMPVMDGLELLRRLQDKPAPPKVVLLTCYEDFAKAQSAIRYGAEDYLTKVLLSEEEFVKSLEKTAESLRKEMAGSERLLRLQLRELLLYPSEDNAASLKRAGFDAGQAAIAVIRTERPLPSGYAEQELFAEAAGEGRCLPVQMSACVWCLVFRSAPHVRDGEFYGRYQAQCARIGSRLRKEQPAGGFVAAASGICYRTEDLPSAYRCAWERSEAGFYEEQGEWIEGDPGRSWVPYPAESFRRLLADIGSAAAAGDGEEAAGLLRQWMAAVSEAYRPEPGQARQMALELADRLDGFAKASPDEAGPAPGLTERLRRKANEALHAKALLEEAGALADLLARRYPGGSMRKEIKEALRLIARQYADIELGEAARRVNLSPSWFAALFRNETGRSFHDYVQQYRLDQARKLLETTDLKVYEIAQRVGIPNSRYFSRLFLEHAGAPPLDYRKRASGST